jgi:hypothetical protein
MSFPCCLWARSFPPSACHKVSGVPRSPSRRCLDLRAAKEGVPISLSTLADQVGGCTAALTLLFKRLEAYVLSAERLHGDDTTVPVLAKGANQERVIVALCPMSG